ncbi:MAG: TolC family protein [Deltaproteobacteria bacterium]|nr:TolC family protein [Deltaproteobacteria bacterium]
MSVIVRSLICFCAVLFMLSTNGLCKEDDKAEKSDDLRIVRSEYESNQKVDENIPSPNPSPSLNKPLELTLGEFIRLVKEKNEKILYQELEWAIRKDAVAGEWAIFEPGLITSYEHQKTRNRSTAEEFVSRSSTLLQGGNPQIYDARNNTYKTAIETLMNQGARFRVEYNIEDLSNSMADTMQQGLNQYRSFLGFTIQQPLLKNAGKESVMARINLAETDAEIAFQNYRREMMAEIYNGASAYWDLYLAQEKYAVVKESVRIASELLKHNREWVRVGRMAETEILEAEAGLSLRKSIERAALQNLVTGMNQIRNYFSTSTSEMDVEIRAVEKPQTIEIDTVEIKDSLAVAYRLRPEYIAGLKKIEREGLQISYAENQRWPQLDFKATYGLNGLDLSPRKSLLDGWDRDFETWMVGIEFQIPLGGGKKSRSELDAAKKRKKQSLLEVKAIETFVANETDTTVNNLYNTRAQLDHYRDAVSLRENLLEVETARFKTGKSDSRMLLEREGDLLQSKEAELEALVNNMKALLALEKAEGILLLNYGIEVMEVTE